MCQQGHRQGHLEHRRPQDDALFQNARQATAPKATGANACTRRKSSRLQSIRRGTESASARTTKGHRRGQGQADLRGSNCYCLLEQPAMAAVPALRLWLSNATSMLSVCQGGKAPCASPSLRVSLYFCASAVLCRERGGALHSGNAPHNMTVNLCWGSVHDSCMHSREGVAVGLPQDRGCGVNSNHAPYRPLGC